MPKITVNDNNSVSYEPDAYEPGKQTEIRNKIAVLLQEMLDSMIAETKEMKQGLEGMHAVQAMIVGRLWEPCVWTITMPQGHTGDTALDQLRIKASIASDGWDKKD